MNDFELKDLGNGKFAISGDMTFETAEQILRASRPVFRRYENVHVDMSEVETADSAGLALLLEWMSWARQGVAKIDFVAIPASLRAVAQAAELEDIVRCSS